MATPYSRLSVSPLKLDLHQTQRARRQFYSLRVRGNPGQVLICGIKECEPILSLRDETQGRPNFAGPNPIAFLHDETLSWSPLDTVPRETIANGVRLIVVIDRHISSIREWGDNGVFDKYRLSL